MSSLSQLEITALNEALDDEYRAWATYDQVIRDFGEVRPFIPIRDAERQQGGRHQGNAARQRRRHRGERAGGSAANGQAHPGGVPGRHPD